MEKPCRVPFALIIAALALACACATPAPPLPIALLRGDGTSPPRPAAGTSIDVILDDRAIVTFSSGPELRDGIPFLEAGPLLRFLDAEIVADEDAASWTVERGGIRVRVVHGWSSISVNEAEKGLSLPIESVPSGFAVPVDFFTVAFGMEWSYDEASRTLKLRTRPLMRMLPFSATVPAGSSLRFSAFASNGTKPVFSVIGGPSGGSVDPSGLYSAPSRPGTYAVRASLPGVPGAAVQSRVRVYSDVMEFAAPSLEPRIVAQGWAMEEYLPGLPIGGAPFDVAVLPDGRMITIGVNRGRVYDKYAVIRADGSVAETGIPSPVNRGGLIEATSDGRIWNWEPVRGELYVSKDGDDRATLLCEGMSTWGSGKLAVRDDGSEAYIAYSGMPDGIYRRALYLWTRSAGLRTLLDSRSGADIRQVPASVEITKEGRLFYIYEREVRSFGTGGSLDFYCGLEGFRAQEESWTSDGEGNLYFAGVDSGGQRGVFRIGPDKEIRALSWIGKAERYPLGMEWNERLGAVVGAVRQANNVAAYGPSGILMMLPLDTYVNLPTSMRITEEGTLFVNGEESGLYKVSPRGDASPFCIDPENFFCYGPPPVDFAFDSDGSIVYNGTSPALPKRIYRVARDGSYEVIGTPDSMPRGIDLGPDGRLYTVDLHVRKAALLREGGILEFFENPALNYPVGLNIAEDGTFYVSCADEGTIVKGDARQDNFEFERPVIAAFKPGSPARILLREPGLSFTYFDRDPDGTFYLAGWSAFALFDASSGLTMVAENLDSLIDAKKGKDGYIYVTRMNQNLIYRFRKAK